jgi:glycosyltransferase involved in cell wall biosynthesis
MVPKVTFVVPCYNLANLLPECVNSILCQTFTDFEVLVMDDCSPDNTPEVARSFGDSRVRHVRNETNIRHLANYNKGIGMARGEYVWLISADDRLRRSYVLERYVRLMDDHPEVGYVYCPVIALQNGQEGEVLPWAYGGAHDRIFRGKDFLVDLLPANRISAPSAMARTACYRREDFPLDLPYAGDWYLWCLFALSQDVAYLAEPMVCYRLHEQSITSMLDSGEADVIAIDEINVRWRIMTKAVEAGCPEIAARCLEVIIHDYAMRRYMKEMQDHRRGLTEEAFDKSLSSHACDESMQKYIRAKTSYCLANNYLSGGNSSMALRYFAKAMAERPTLWKAWLKYAMTFLQSMQARKISNPS